jgi:hypothetical protein
MYAKYLLVIEFHNNIASKSTILGEKDNILGE